MTERDYKKYIYEKANKVKTKKDLDKLLEEVVKNKTLDYGTIVYAISACMLATANYINKSEVGGITGFQASFIAWEMIKKFLHESNVGMRLLDYEEMLYPQYEYKFSKVISKDVWKTLQKQAKINLKEVPVASPRVIEHWRKIVNGKVPFGYEVKEDE